MYTDVRQSVHLNIIQLFHGLDMLATRVVLLDYENRLKHECKSEYYC